MNYVIKKGDGVWKALSMYTFDHFDQDIYYRNATLRDDVDVKFQLADIILPNGVLRVDKAISATPVEVHLGHYSLPCLDSKIKERTIKKQGHTAYAIDNGKFQLTMVPLNGWEDVRVENTSGLYPETKQSAVLNAEDHFTGEKIFITLLLWNKTGNKLTDKQLFPVKDILVSKDKKSVTVWLNDGTQKKVKW